MCHTGQVQALHDTRVVRHLPSGRRGYYDRLPTRAPATAKTLRQQLGVPTSLEILDCGELGERYALVYEDPPRKRAKRKKRH